MRIVLVRLSTATSLYRTSLYRDTHLGPTHQRSNNESVARNLVAVTVETAALYPAVRACVIATVLSLVVTMRRSFSFSKKKKPRADANGNRMLPATFAAPDGAKAKDTFRTVSYTHLTLPTILLV